MWDRYGEFLGDGEEISILVTQTSHVVVYRCGNSMDYLIKESSCI